jgi:capsular polysaccharide transport system permease protein
MHLIPFVWTGYLPILMFRHTTGLAINSIRMNAPLLYHRAVTPFDILLGRCGLEVLGSIAAMVTSYIVIYMIGEMPWPADPPLFLVGVFYMAWWCFAVAIILAALSERSELVAHIWSPVGYMYLPTSGFMYMAEWLPTSVRNVALTVMPSLPAYEMIRGGLFGSQVQVYYDFGYLTWVLSILTLLGLWLVHNVRQYIEFE